MFLLINPLPSSGASPSPSEPLSHFVLACFATDALPLHAYLAGFFFVFLQVAERLELPSFVVERARNLLDDNTRQVCSYRYLGTQRAVLSVQVR